MYYRKYTHALVFIMIITIKVVYLVNHPRYN